MIKVEIPLLEEKIESGQLVRNERSILLEVDPSVYSEERWEQNFPAQAEREGLFEYIERVQASQVSERVRVASMLKALYCFVESNDIPTYKSFAQMFVPFAAFHSACVRAGIL